MAVAWLSHSQERGDIRFMGSKRGIYWGNLSACGREGVVAIQGTNQKFCSVFFVSIRDNRDLNCFDLYELQYGKFSIAPGVDRN